MSSLNRAGPPISEPTASIFWRQSQWLVRCLIIVGVLYLLIRWFVSSHCINHLVIICDGHGDPVHLVEVILEHPSPSACWSQSINLSCGEGSEKLASLAVVDIEHAWFDGNLVLSDEKGKAWASVGLRPRGRCGGTLVVRVDENQDVKTWWSALPK